MASRKNGFTLIELIVVITIIAVASAVAAVSFAGTSKKARDSRRISDLEKLRIALELTKQIGTTYPATLGTMESLGTIQKLPVDPKTTLSYDYHQGTSYYSYYICANLEDSSQATSCTDCGGDYNHCVTSP